MDRPILRRRIWRRRAAAGVVIAWVAAFGALTDGQSSQVRLAMVNVPDDLVRTLLPLFQQQHGHSAAITYTGNDPFAEARAGRADLVIAHFGHSGVEPFVTDGVGLWPKAVFANQMALLGPANDPAGVRGLRSLAEALRRIASTKARYVANSSEGAVYLTQIASGDSRVNTIEATLQNAAAVRLASDRGAYVLWGVPPFLRLKRQPPQGEPLRLEPLVVGDPLLQRIMVAIVVNADSVKGANTAAAKTFQAFLLRPEIQARIAAFRYPDFDQQVWWPAGRHNFARD